MQYVTFEDWLLFFTQYNSLEILQVVCINSLILFIVNFITYIGTTV